jgi:early secretory antigenic target protein ESAT-6
MTEIKVTFAALESAQAGLAGTAGRMAGQLDELKRYLAPMVETWQGRAADDYGIRQREWDTAAAELTSVLTQIGVALGAANDGYWQVEQANAARWA